MRKRRGQLAAFSINKNDHRSLPSEYVSSRVHAHRHHALIARDLNGSNRFGLVSFLRTKKKISAKRTG